MNGHNGQVAHSAPNDHGDTGEKDANHPSYDVPGLCTDQDGSELQVFRLEPEVLTPDEEAALMSRFRAAVKRTETDPEYRAYIESLAGRVPAEKEKGGTQ